MRTSRALRVLACVLACAAAGPAPAQDYPVKPVRLLVGFPPGGVGDLGARVVAQKMSEGLGRSVVVENNPGGGGVIASDAVAKAPADGYSLLLATGAFTAQAAVMKRLPYDPVRDFAAISLIVTYPFVIAVAPDSPYRTLNELIDHAKRNPAKLNYGAPIGTGYHLGAELFASMSGIALTFVPYRGGSEPMTEVMAGRLHVAFEAILSAATRVKAGKLRALAVTSATPSSSLPGVPTAAQVLPGYEVTAFQGLAGPAGLPRPIVERLNAEVRRMLQSAELRQRFSDWGGQITPSTPEEMQRHVEAEIAKWKRVAEARKIAID